MSGKLTEKQKELLRLWKSGKLKRINILEGAVRSGKTYISLVLWALMVAEAPVDSAFLMAGKTLDTLKRNVLMLLQEMVGCKNFCFSITQKEGRLFGRRVYLEGASNSNAENKIRGMTLYGAYCDELTLFSESFFAMLLSRLSAEGAKLIATTNPDSPHHWLMRKYLEREDLDILDMRFSITDNSFLPSDYVEALKKEYTGVFYRRFIAGEWVVASGLVYPMFDRNVHVRDIGENKKGLYYISIDYGTRNPCSMGLWQVTAGKAHRVAEYYHDSRKNNCLKTDEEYYAALCELAAERVIQFVIVDPSAASFIEVIRRHGRFSVRRGNNAVLDGIRRVSDCLKRGSLTIAPTCVNAIAEFEVYAWDEAATEDKVIKACDHAMDEIRYFVRTVMHNNHL